MKKRLIIIGLMFCVIFSVLCVRLGKISMNSEYAQLSAKQNTKTITVGSENANIYDYKYKSFVNQNKKLYAVVFPSEDSNSMIKEYAVNPEDIEVDAEAAYICEVKSKINTNDIITVSVPERYDENQLAAHLIGYTSENTGVCGIEYAYDEFLRSYENKNKISYLCDGYGELVLGEKNIEEMQEMKAGVVTTLDYEIQKVCEKEAKNYLKKGAIVVMDVKTGEIRSMVSCPSFSVFDLEKSLDDTENTPLINRALCAYNLGSIFKLTTAASALEQGLDLHEEYNCDGAINVEGQKFTCHEINGHGLMNMKSAIVNSCNTYFINLGLKVNSSRLLWTASALSYGREIYLCDGIYSQGGYLQTLSELENPAEKANLSFGQGRLLATPLQVAQMTCAFANEGKVPSASLIKGVTEDGKTLSKSEDTGCFTQGISSKAADTVKEYMIAMVEDENNAAAKPALVTAGGKTATAQTGKYADDGHEILNCWFTGFFPADNPEYVITIMQEDGTYSLKDCGAIFARIADSVYENILTK